MRHYIGVVIALFVLFLGLFAIVEATGLPLLTDPTDQLSGAAPVVAGALGVGLLVVDVILPVPSSVVMLLHGVLFGVALGALLSMVGSVGAAALGFAIGRRGGPVIDRLVPAAERRRADAMLGRWGVLAIIVTRPIPILAETTAILAGATRDVSWRRAMAAAAIGSLPAAVLYAIAGAFAASFANLTIVFASVIALAMIVWMIERVFRSRQEGRMLADDTSTPTGTAQ